MISTKLYRPTERS